MTRLKVSFMLQNISQCIMRLAFKPIKSVRFHGYNFVCLDYEPILLILKQGTLSTLIWCSLYPSHNMDHSHISYHTYTNIFIIMIVYL